MPGNIGPSVISAAISTAGNLVGGYLNEFQQKRLMDYQSAINAKQWERETAYNTPVNQMARLREAGLNPDLAIGGNVANTSGSSPGTSIPSSNAFSGLGSNAVQSAVAASQIELNEAAAANQRSQSGEHDINKKFLEDSLPDRLKQIALANNATEKDIEKMDSDMKYLSAQTDYIINGLKPLAWAETALTDEQYHGQRYKNAFDFERAKRANEFVDAELKSILAKTGLDEAQTKYVTAQTNLLWRSMDALVQMRENQAELFGVQKLYYQSLKDQVDQLIKYYPYMIAEQIAQAHHLFEFDDQGNMVLNPDGTPKMKDFREGWDDVIYYVDDVLDLVETGVDIRTKMLNGDSSGLPGSGKIVPSGFGLVRKIGPRALRGIPFRKVLSK